MFTQASYLSAFCDHAEPKPTRALSSSTLTRHAEGIWPDMSTPTQGGGGGGEDKNNFCFLVTRVLFPSPFQNRPASFLNPPPDSGKFLLRPLLTPCVPDFTMGHMVPQHTGEGNCPSTVSYVSNCLQWQPLRRADTWGGLPGCSGYRRSFTGLLFCVFTPALFGSN